MSEKLAFVFQMAKYTTLSLPACKKLMRLTATRNRLETELTNGYHTKDGKWDEPRTNAAKAKRDRIDSKIEYICGEHNLSVEYGALTVRVKLFDGREVYIP